MAIGVSVGVANNINVKPVYAEETSFVPSDFSGQGTSGTGSAISATKSTVTFSCNKGYGTTQVRCYSGGKITISSTNTITSIVFTWSGSYSGGLDSSYTSLSTNSWEYSLTSQLRMTSCAVTYSTGAAPVDSVSVSLDKTTANLDVNGNAAVSLTATATATGNATTGLTAESDAPLVASVSTDAPESGVAFTVTALSEGTAHITVASSWNAEVTASCTINVVDTTPRLVNFKKVDSIESGMQVLIATFSNGNAYYLPSTTANSSPLAASCTYSSLAQRIISADAKKTFTVSGNANDGWQFANESGKKLCVNANSNTGIRVMESTDTFTVEATTNGFSLKSNDKNRYLGVYSETDWRSYDSVTASNYKNSNNNEYNSQWINFWVEVTKPAQTISGATAAYTDETVALSSSATTAPTWSIVAGDTTAPGAAVSNTGIVSVTGAGSVKVKATHDDYDDAYYVVSFTERPGSPFVDLEEASINAYTGQDDYELSFSYDCFTSLLSIESDDESVVTVSSSIQATSGTLTICFVGAGSTDIVFYDGSTEVERLPVVVTQSTVTITGLPSSKSIYVGRTFDLGRTIAVSHTGAYSEDVGWESSNNNVVSVSSAGVITGVAEGTADVTVTSVSYPSATMTCSVTISATPTAFFIDFGDIKNTNPTDLSTSTFLSTFSVDSKVSCTSITKVCASNSANMLKMGSNSSSSSITLQIPSVFYLTKVEMEVFEGNNLNLEVQSGAEGSTKEVQGASTAGTYIFDDYLSTERSSIVTISTSAVKAIYLTSLILHYEKRVTNLPTQTKLSYHYEDNGNGGFNFSDISIRFGGLISKAIWNEIDTSEHLISGFGVMITEGRNIDENETIEEYKTMAVLAENSTNTHDDIVDYYMSKAEMATPVESGDNYFWNLFQAIDPADVEDVFVAVAYIKVGDEYVFMDQVRYSVKTLATDYLANRGCNAQTADGSLSYLAN